MKGAGLSISLIIKSDLRLDVSVKEMNKEEREIVNGILDIFNRREAKMVGNFRKGSQRELKEFAKKDKAIRFMPSKNITETNNLIKAGASFVGDRMGMRGRNGVKP